MKGKSVLSSHINIVEDVVIDYMHAVLEGVSKSLLCACLDSKHHNYRFYLGRVTKQIDERILTSSRVPKITKVSSFRKKMESF